jgi:membrane protein YdbS with pleckstrin-like domain
MFEVSIVPPLAEHCSTYLANYRQKEHDFFNKFFGSSYFGTICIMPEIFKTKEKESEQIQRLLGNNYSHNLWSSFVVNPNLSFQSQHDQEEVILLGRRHPITNLGWLSLVCIGLFVPMVWVEFPFFAVLTEVTLTKITILWYLSIIFYVIMNFLMWFYNVYIVTDERLIDVDFAGLLNKTVNIAELEKLEDVNYTQNGLMDSLFNMGDVIVQTASEQKTQDASGELSAFTFEKIASPDMVAQVISQLMDNQQEELRRK